ncbi:hypothetical protein [Synechococcus sp. MIT S9509]|uniref:hypothetical protein n=1 Tax=Synechococcus sp. MIT S9509 TaxID=1801630 RepID=UPI0039B0DB27
MPLSENQGTHPPKNTVSTIKTDNSSQAALPFIEDVRCFLEEGQMQIAVFGYPSTFPDGWLFNRPWDQVFCNYPVMMPLDQRISFKEAISLADPLPSFCETVNYHEKPHVDTDSISVQDKLCTLKDIASSISEAENLPYEQTLKIARVFLQHLAEGIEKDKKLRLSNLSFMTFTKSAEAADGDNPRRPERKLTIVNIVSKKANSENMDE